MCIPILAKYERQFFLVFPPVFLSLFGSFLRFIWQIKATIPLESLNKFNGIVEQIQWNRSTISMDSFLRFVVLVSGDWWFLQAKPMVYVRQRCAASRQLLYVCFVLRAHIPIQICAPVHEGDCGRAQEW